MRWRWLPLVRLERAALEEATAGWQTFVLGIDALERELNAMSDRGWHVPASTTAPLLAWAEERGLRPFELQVRRAIGLRDSDRAELERAAGVAAACGAGSPLARVRFEIARGLADRAGMACAIDSLEAMGDRAQIKPYEG